MSKFLITTADDFGLHETVNVAIELAHRRGVLKAASLMVGGPAAASAIRLAKELSMLRVGLHLVLVDGCALSSHQQSPDLVDEAGFMDERMIGKSVLAFGRLRFRNQIAREIRAQFEAFAATGLALDHVNLHKHFHLHPTILEIVIRIGLDYGMNAVRWPNEPYWFGADRHRRRAAVGHALLRPWLSLMRRRLDRAGIFYNHTLFGIARSGAMTEAALLQVIERLPDGVNEVYLHPAASTTPLTASMSDYRHEDELAALLSEHVREAIAHEQLSMGGFQDALAHARASPMPT